MGALLLSYFTLVCVSFSFGSFDVLTSDTGYAPAEHSVNTAHKTKEGDKLDEEGKDVDEPPSWARK
jgi:hypothetical protein